MVLRGERISNDPDLLDNLQVWFENEYDTCLLHSELAFSLLGELVKADDLLAKKVFKKEIAKRFESGYLPVILTLISEGHLNTYLDEEERSSLLVDSIFLGNIETSVKNDIENRLNKSFAFWILQELIINYNYQEPMHIMKRILFEILRSENKESFNNFISMDFSFNLFSIDELNDFLYNSSVFIRIINHRKEVEELYVNIVNSGDYQMQRHILVGLLIRVNSSLSDLSIAVEIKVFLNQCRQRIS